MSRVSLSLATRMRAMPARLVVALLAFLLLGGAACKDADDETRTDSPSQSAASTPATSSAAETVNYIAPTPPASAALEQFIIECLRGVDVATAAAQAIANCPAPYPTKVQAEAAEGPLQLLLVDFVSSPERCAFTVSYLVWPDGAGWHARSMGQLLGGDMGTRLVRTLPLRSEDLAADGARSVVLPDGSLRLGVIHSGGECGSGAPQDGFILLGLDGDQWNKYWDSSGDERTRFGHTRMQFAGDGIDSLQLTGDSWFRPDPRRKVFHESNSGPHRYFEQTWVRSGDSYKLAAETANPTSYNTLVEFVYSLTIGDRIAAERWVVDSDLVNTAISLGLNQDPLDERWSGYCGNRYSDGSPCTVLINELGENNVIVTDRGVRLTMTQTGTDSLISAIEPCTYWYDDMGGHCD